MAVNIAEIEACTYIHAVSAPDLICVVSEIPIISVKLILNSVNAFDQLRNEFGIKYYNGTISNGNFMFDAKLLEGVV